MCNIRRRGPSLVSLHCLLGLRGTLRSTTPTPKLCTYHILEEASTDRAWGLLLISCCSSLARYRPCQRMTTICQHLHLSG